AGILAAMMSTVASSLNSLASATTHDIYAPLTGRTDEEHLMRMGKRFTLLWAGILIGGALLFQLVQQGTPVVVIALQVASFTYGGLLGGFLLAVLSKRARERDAILGISTAIGVLFVIWAAQQFALMPRLVDPLWFSLLGSLIVLAVGGASAARGPAPAAGAATTQATETHRGRPLHRRHRRRRDQHDRRRHRPGRARARPARGRTGHRQSCRSRRLRRPARRAGAPRDRRRGRVRARAGALLRPRRR